MKKLLFTVLLSFLVIGVFAQKKTLKNAQKALNKKTYDEAIELALAASKDAETMENPDVYVILATATLYKYEPDNTNLALAQQSYDYFRTAIEKGGDKVENKIMEEVVLNPATGFRLGGGEGLRFLEMYVVSQGNLYFDEGEYAKAYDFFKMATDIMGDNIDYQFYAGYSAQNGDLVDESLPHFQKVLEANAETPYDKANFAYNGLIDYYNNKKDWDNALKFIEEAQVSYPDEKLYAEYEIDVLIRSDRMDEAINSLNEVIAKGGAKASQYYALAFLQWSNENWDESQKAAIKATEIDPKHHDALYIAGVIYYNDAAALLKEANNETDNAKFEEKRMKAVKLFKSSQPYFERAHNAKPTEISYLSPLSTIYDQLDMDTERDATLKKIEALEGGE
jgi:tetratricopeptide (TPR) repeat protein